ncbi:MAG: hypothetical protein KGO51_07020 [Alphaproteobacteria bacterium]|nr:hypothetical protein [Alphaproteobacteria bacterium]
MALEDILARDPMASLEDIRRAHPPFQNLSLDHLGVRLARVLERRMAEATA